MTSVTVRVPITIRKRGGRKLVVSPDGTVGALPPPRARIDSTLIKALARAHRWKRMLDDGRYGSVSELAAAEKLDRGYLGRILMLTLLAPDIVEVILDGRQPAELGVHVLREGFPVEWGEQWEYVWQADHKHDNDAGSDCRDVAIGPRDGGHRGPTAKLVSGGAPGDSILGKSENGRDEHPITKRTPQARRAFLAGRQRTAPAR